MRNAIQAIRRMVIRWQLKNLEAAIRHILIARNQALVTMISLQKERDMKRRLLQGLESPGA